MLTLLDTEGLHRRPFLTLFEFNSLRRQKERDAIGRTLYRTCSTAARTLLLWGRLNACDPRLTESLQIQLRDEKGVCIMIDDRSCVKGKPSIKTGGTWSFLPANDHFRRYDDVTARQSVNSNRNSEGCAPKHYELRIFSLAMICTVL